jgi:hypothetical protein
MTADVHGEHHAVLNGLNYVRAGDAFSVWLQNIRAQIGWFLKRSSERYGNLYPRPSGQGSTLTH